VENFGGDLELKRLDLTWSGQVDLTAATLRSNCGSISSSVVHCVSVKKPHIVFAHNCDIRQPNFIIFV